MAEEPVMALVSPPAHNERELTREMLVVVLDYFSTLLPSKFDSRLVRLVVHGGASMLLHPDLDRLASQTPPFIFSPKWSLSGEPLPITSTPQISPAIPVLGQPLDPTRPDPPIPDVKRTQTRDVDIVARSLDVEWRQVGIRDAFDRLKECIALTARRFGLGLDWMNADADVALPMAFDPAANITYDPIHADAVMPNNVRLHTIYKSPNGVLQLVSVTPFWAVALKMVRYTKSDPGDICLILRNGTNLSGTRWTTELVEKWLVDNCWPMGYASYDQQRWSLFRSRIKHIITMVNAYENVSQPTNKDDAIREDKWGRRSKKKSKNMGRNLDHGITVHSTPIIPPIAIPPPQSMQPTSIPSYTTPSWQQQQPPQLPYTYAGSNAYSYIYYPPQEQQPELRYRAVPTQFEVPVRTAGPSTSPSHNPRSLADWVMLPSTNQGVTKRNTDGTIGRSHKMDIEPGSGVNGGRERSGDGEKRRKMVMEWSDANKSKEIPVAIAATNSTPNYVQPHVRGYNQPSHPSQAIPLVSPLPPATTSIIVPPPPIVSPTPGISVRSPTPELGGSIPPSSALAAGTPVMPPPKAFPISPSRRSHLEQQVIRQQPPSLQLHQLQPQEQTREDGTSPPIIPSPSLLTTLDSRRSVPHHARYGPYERDGPLEYHRNLGTPCRDEGGEDKESDEGEIHEDEGGRELMDVNRRPAYQVNGDGTRESRSLVNAQRLVKTHDWTGSANERTSLYVPLVPTQYSNPGAQQQPYTTFSNQNATQPPTPTQMPGAWTRGQPLLADAGAAITRAESQEPRPRTWTGRGGIKELAELISGVQIQPASSSATQPQSAPQVLTSPLRSQHPQIHLNSWVTTLQTPSASCPVIRTSTPLEDFVPPLYDAQPEFRANSNCSSSHPDDIDDGDGDSDSGSSNMDNNSLLSFPPPLVQMPVQTMTSLYSYPAYLAHTPPVTTSEQLQQQQQKQSYSISTWTN